MNKDINSQIQTFVLALCRVKNKDGIFDPYDFGEFLN